MNRMLILQIGMLVSFSNISGMETVKGLLGMSRRYSCKYTPDGKKESSISLKIVNSDGNGKGFWFSNQDKYHDLKTGVFSLRLGESTVTVEGECAQALMEAIVTRPSGKPVKIETTLNTKKTEPMMWEFKGTGEAYSQELAVKNYAHRLNNALKSANKDVSQVSIESGEGALAKEHIRAVLEVPYSFNPRGSFNIKIPVNDTAKNKEINLVLNQTDVKKLYLYALALDKTNSVHNNIKVNYTEQEGERLDRLAFLDKKTMEEQLQSYYFKRLCLKRGLYISVAGFLAWLAYFQFGLK